MTFLICFHARFFWHTKIYHENFGRWRKVINVSQLRRLQLEVVFFALWCKSLWFGHIWKLNWNLIYKSQVLQISLAFTVHKSYQIFEACLKKYYKHFWHYSLYEFIAIWNFSYTRVVHNIWKIFNIESLKYLTLCISTGQSYKLFQAFPALEFCK